MRYKLGDIAPIRQGNVADEDEYWLLNLDMVESNTGRIIDYLTVPKEEIGNSTVTFDTKNVLYSKLRPYLNKVVLPQQSGYATSEMLPLRPDKNVITREYLTYFLRSPKFVGYINEKTGGAKMPRANISDLKAVEIDCPDIDVQKKITEAFDRLTDIIAKRQQELIALDDLIKARFVEMFDLSKCVYKSLGECTDFVDYRGHTPELSDEGTIRMINAKSVGKGFFKYVDEFITEKTYESWMHRGFGYPGDILFVTEGHTFGNTCLIPKDMTKFALGQRVITIKGRDEIENAFLCSYMQTDMFGKDINVYRTGGTAQGIRSKDLIKVMVPIPPIEQQKDFMKFVNQVDKSKVAVQKALTEAQLLFDSLMQQYFG